MTDQPEPRTGRAAGTAVPLPPPAPDTTRLPFRFADRYRLAARPFGITPARAWLDLTPTKLKVRFGPWLVETALDNVTGAQITGPYRFIKTAGPARLAVTDRGLTFASNGDRGVCISFDKPVWGIEPLGIIRHPTLTVTVADVERLATLLNR